MTSGGGGGDGLVTAAPGSKLLIRLLFRNEDDRQFADNQTLSANLSPKNIIVVVLN